MTKSIFKLILAGMLFGAVVFFMPMFILGIFIFFAIFRLFMRMTMGRGRFMEHRLAFANKIRSMSEEEYAGFKQKMDKHNCYQRIPQEEIN